MRARCAVGCALLIGLSLAAGCRTEIQDRAFAIATDWEANESDLISMVRTNPWLGKARDKDGYTLLGLVQQRANRELDACLLDAGAEVNVRNSLGVTPLHCFAVMGDLALVERALAASADPQATDYWGDAPLVGAAGRKVVARLLKEKTDIETVDRALVANGLSEGHLRDPGSHRDPNEKAEWEKELAETVQIATLLREKRRSLPGVSSLWREPSGGEANRMEWGQLGDTVYRAIWKDGNEDRLVCFRSMGVHMFGEFCNACVFDRDMTLNRWDVIRLREGDAPYALTEVRITSGAVDSPSFLGRWSLAVATSNKAGPIDPNLPFQVGESMERGTPNQIDALLIEWDEVDSSVRYLDQRDYAYDIRWAEAGPCLIRELSRAPSTKPAR